MPLLRNKNQPYFPDPDSPNNYQCGPERYCHPVTVGDTVWSQFYQTPCNNNEVIDPEFDDYSLGAELVTNGTFAINPAGNWTFGAAFTWDNINTEMDCLNGSGDTLVQTGLTLTDGNLYRVTFDCVITNGQFDVLFGYPDPNQTQTPTVSETGSYSFDLIYLAGLGNESITFLSALNFTGSISNVSVKLISNTYWTPNGDWILSNGQACHRVGGINDLDENVAAYIDANSYYKLEFTITNRTAGDISVGMANVNTGAVSANGNFIYYLTPTATGALIISANSDFDGCISNLAVYKLRNDYSGEILDSDGNIVADLTSYFNYYQDYVTLSFTFDDLELPDGCYSINVYDQCIIESDNLVLNGDFVDGYTNWTRNNGNIQYDIISDQLQFKFYPFSQGFTDYVTNGDFSSGSGWTLNAGWSIIGGKAVHTPGNTGTLFQTMTLPTPPLPATGYPYYVKFTVTNWTAGTITLKLGNATNGTSYTWKGNDIFFQQYSPRQSGSVDIVFTPSSTFDGEIDNVACILPNAVSSFPIITNTPNPLFTPGNYQTEWEIISSSDPNISVNFNLVGALPAAPYQSDIGVQSYTQAYSLNGGSVRGVANFQKTSIDYVQTNLVEGDITVDNISVVKIEPFEATYSSECLQYNSNGFPRTKMIVGYCDQNAFGFEFQNTGFRLQQRAEIRSIAPTYPKTTNIMKMGTGNARIAYAEIEKYWQLHTGFASETFHDTMAAIISCDHFQIGDTEATGVEYIAEAEDYSPNWQTDGAYVLAAAVINLRVKEKGQVFNRHI